MPFYVSLTVLLCILNLAVLAACAQILSRVVRLEGAERARASFEVLPGVRRLVEGAGVPIDDVPELSRRAREHLRVHVVSAACRSCHEHVRALESSGGPEDVIVVASAEERQIVERAGGRSRIPVVEARALVQSTIFAGYELPVTLELFGSVLTAVSAPAVGAGVPGR
jgi:hypothetical protein